MSTIFDQVIQRLNKLDSREAAHVLYDFIGRAGIACDPHWSLTDSDKAAALIVKEKLLPLIESAIADVEKQTPLAQVRE